MLSADLDPEPAKTLREKQHDVLWKNYVILRLLFFACIFVNLLLIVLYLLKK